MRALSVLFLSPLLLATAAILLGVLEPQESPASAAATPAVAVAADDCAPCGRAVLAEAEPLDSLR